jgi:micrococcal nuclease
MLHIARLLTFLCLLASAPVAVVQFQQPALQRLTQNNAETVYVTRTGKRYHRANCRYLATSRISMSLKDAQAKGYTACKACRPPQ